MKGSKEHYLLWQNIQVEKNAIYYDKTQHANFRGNPLYQVTKRHLNNS